MRSREARLRDGDSTVENIGKEAAQIQWKKKFSREHKQKQNISNGMQLNTINTFLFSYFSNKFKFL